MIVACHQPDLLPYSGFWYKMAKADIFDLKVFDQFQDRGYQRRVRMRGAWASVPIVDRRWRSSILDVRIDPERARQTLTDNIVGRYAGSRHWDRHGPTILEMVAAIHTDRLWQLNLALIIGVRDLLGITTPISISSPLVERGSEGLMSMLGNYETTTYLSGTGGRAYMGDCKTFSDAGIEVVFSRHRPVTGDSILSVLMDHDDPMQIVLAEDPSGAEEVGA
jgi:hypothetical protein